MAIETIETARAMRLEKLNKILNANVARNKAIETAKEAERIKCVAILKEYAKRGNELNTLANTFFAASSVDSCNFCVKLSSGKIYRAPALRVVMYSAESSGHSSLLLKDNAWWYHYYGEDDRKCDVDRLPYDMAVPIALGMIEFEEKLNNAIDSL